MAFKITKEEATQAKHRGMNAQLLRAELFTTAIESLNNFIAAENGLFHKLDINRRIFPHEIVTNYIGERNLAILKQTDIINVCGSGYTIEQANIPHKEIETMSQELEKYYFA